MANTLLITKLSDGSFSFVINGDVVNAIINLRNDLTTVGNECHFKTSEGANLIKLQQILYHEVTIVDGATLPVASSPLDLRIKLISVGFWDWMNPSGGGGSNRFDLLLDTFSYFGNNGKIPMVDESQLKLIPYSLPDFSYLNLFPNPLVADKGLKVNSLATAYELYDIVNTITQFIRLGYTSTAPSEDIIYKALELKANLSDIPVLPDDYANIVYVNDIDPNTATIFDLNNPPTVNDNLLKEGVSNLYIGTDASTWVYNLATSNYVTKEISSEFSNFYYEGTDADATGNKTASIERSGTVGGAPGTASNHFVTKSQHDLKLNTSDYTTASVKSLLGITTLSGSNTGDETTATLKTKIDVELGYALSDEISSLTVGNLISFRMPYAMTLSEVRISVNDAPTVSTIIVDIKEAGVSIFSTLVSIDSGELTSVTASVPAVISDSSLADDALITVSTTQIGSGNPGKGLKLLLKGKKT